MTNVGTVVLIGIIYALDVCYIALTCSPMTPLELQPLLTSAAFCVPQRSHVAVLDCPVLYIRHSKVGHDSLGHVNISYMSMMPSILHQRVAL